MATGFEDIQKLSKDQVDIAMESMGAMSRGLQALASEAVDYQKETFAASSAAFEKLLSAGTLDNAVAVQSDYFRTAYEGYMGRATKFGEIVTDMARGAYKPYETMIGRIGK